MSSKKISNAQGAFLTALLTLTNAYSVLPGSEAGRGVWLADTAACLLALFVAYLLASACDTADDESFCGVLIRTVGRSGAGIIGAVFVILALLTAVVSMTVFSRFVQITALPRTPQIIIPVILIVIASFSVSHGLSATGGAATLLFWFAAGVFLLFSLSGIGKAEPRLFIPTGENLPGVLKGTGEVFLNRFMFIPALMAIYVRMSDKKTRKKYFLGSLAGAGAALAALGAITVATLGEKISNSDFYPVYTAMSIHSVGGFIQHTEVFACIAMTVSLFFKCSVCLLFASEMISGIFRTERRSGLVLPLALICAASTQLIYDGLSSLRSLLEWKSGAAVILLFNFIAPLFIRMKSKKSS